MFRENRFLRYKVVKSQTITSKLLCVIQTEFEVIQSETILSNVVDRLDLNNEWGKKYNDGQKFKTHETVAILHQSPSLQAFILSRTKTMVLLSDKQHTSHDTMPCANG